MNDPIIAGAGSPNNLSPDRDDQLRVTALSMAIGASENADFSEKEIVEIAKTFLAFLRGETTTA